MNILSNIIPVDVQMDQWLLFHGSSNIYEESITENGLCPKQSQFDISDLLKVESLYDELHWGGIHGGGLGALKPFSIMHDHGHQEGKPLYLTESAHSASLFATKDFAGGEICRALHYCLEDLNEYINEEDLREDHANKLDNYPGIHRIERSLIPKLEWVRGEVEKLSEIKNRVDDIRNSFRYGVIYSIRLDVENLSEIQGLHCMGIKSFRTIPHDELENKYILPASFQKSFDDNEKLFKSTRESGIVKTLMERDGM